MIKNFLIDSFGRVHDYLRISVTDKCNFRCNYCLPEKHCSFMSNAELMTKDEILKIARIFIALGIKKIRITGGEPLLRKDISEILFELSKLPVELAITTNGYYLDNYVNLFKKIGLKSVNVSLDSLKNNKFAYITNKDVFDKVFSNIMLLIKNNFHVKVNVVLLKNFNENEILDFIKWTKNLPVHVRFIEFMPFKENKWQFEKVVTYENVINIIKSQYKIIKLKDNFNSTAKSYKVKSFKGTFALISTISTPFCETCNRLRITADGKLRNCLFAMTETDLLSNLRANNNITKLILQNLKTKKFKRGGLPEFEQKEINHYLSNRKMVQIGG